MTRLPGIFRDVSVRYMWVSVCMMESVTYGYPSWVCGARDAHDTAHVPFVFLGPMIWLVHVGPDPSGVRDTRHYIIPALFSLTGPNHHVRAAQESKIFPQVQWGILCTLWRVYSRGAASGRILCFAYQSVSVLLLL